MQVVVVNAKFRSSLLMVVLFVVMSVFARLVVGTNLEIRIGDEIFMLFVLNAVELQLFRLSQHKANRYFVEIVLRENN